MFKKLFFFLVIFLTIFSFAFAESNEQKINLILFQRDDCVHCENQKEFLASLNISDLNITEIDVKQERYYFDKITEKYNLATNTPLTLIGNSIIPGFRTVDTTGKEILNKISLARENKNFNLDIQYYLKDSKKKDITDTADTCGASEEECLVDLSLNNEIEITYSEEFSFFGKVINIKDLGLFSLAAILGTIDGFNPCAMWVLLTLLIALSQVRSRRKMVQIVGLFLAAQAIMYFLILNIWYKTWDLIKLDAIVTPAIGVFSILAGLYFFRKWLKTKDQLTCDVTSTEHQAKITTRIQELAKKPMTWAVAFSVLLIAFSVNIIEFACSIGITQTFTKILEINNLDFLMQQFYMFIYMLGYMIDDFIVFGLALWGYKSFYKFGAKYSKHSILFAAVSMIILGTILVFFKEILVF